MSKHVKAFLVVLALASALGPALFLPSLSAHTPTIAANRPAAPHAPTPFDALRVSPLAGMAIKVKDAGAVAAKWKTRASAASSDYTAGVQGAASDWEAKSAASEDVYKQAVVEAASKGRYGAGVRGSSAKYVKNATTLGPQRFQSGVANAQDAMAGAIAPVLQTIANLNLPPRGVKGTNQERSNIVATALRKMKVGA
jgi:hypothetical protein